MDAVSPEHADAGAAQPNLRYLRFLRWLADRGNLEHAPSSSPRGELSLSVSWMRNEKGQYVALS